MRNAKDKIGGQNGRTKPMKKLNKDYFKDWNYKKHAKFCTAVYLGLYAFDMTVSDFIIKKVLKD